MKRVAVTVLAVVLLVLHGLFGAPAMAQPAPEPPRLRLEVSQLNPRYVTTTSTSLNIAGKITNVGDRRITKLVARLELGEKLATERQFTDSLAGGVANPASSSKFVNVVDSLEPGQPATFNLTVPLGSAASTFQLSKPGVYPLLVNVNGTPDFGGPARLAALNILLPVVGVPGKAPEPPAKALGLSILWPIANTVPRTATMPFRGQLVLTDDTLAAELSPGGRLYSLLTAAQLQQSNEPLFGSMCFALDPDLVDTVELMTHGYQVQAGSGTANGKGVEAAKQWLATLKQLVTSSASCWSPERTFESTVRSASA